jgi:hypothetical protein
LNKECRDGLDGGDSPVGVGLQLNAIKHEADGLYEIECLLERFLVGKSRRRLLLRNVDLPLSADREKQEHIHGRDLCPRFQGNDARIALLEIVSLRGNSSQVSGAIKIDNLRANIESRQGFIKYEHYRSPYTRIYTWSKHTGFSTLANPRVFVN